jgi:hypothetical protein
MIGRIRVCEDPTAEMPMFRLRDDVRKVKYTLMTPSSSPVDSIQGMRYFTRLMGALDARNIRVRGLGTRFFHTRVLWRESR